MKNNITIKPIQLKVVIEDYYDTEHVPFPAMQRQQKVVESIVSDLMKKLERKLIDKRGTSEQKEFKISLKYHEAFALFEICKYQSEVSAGHFEHNTYRIIITQLDKQL